jgi:hypothetical protein
VGKKFTDEDEALLDELGVEADEKAVSSKTPHEERIIAGFEDIQRFVEKHGRAPQHGEDRDIFERIYAVRLDRLLSLPECRAMIETLDHQGLLTGKVTIPQANPDELDDDALLAELGVDSAPTDLAELKHVRSAAEKRAAEEIANRRKCEDFERFKPLFVQVKKDLDMGVRETRAFQRMAEIAKGEFFIVGGQIAYVAERGEEFISEYDRRDSRLRVIYDNGTESDVLLRSLQRALHRDGAGRRITDPAAGPLFGGKVEEGDLASGTIYVLRSKSSLPEIAAHRELIHKIGVTGSDVETRIGDPTVDPTYLLAEVEIVASYKLFNIHRTKLENLIHKVLSAARLELTIKDRFGNPVNPREWFLVPLPVIDEIVDRIRDGSIAEHRYDPKTARLIPLGSNREHAKS